MDATTKDIVEKGESARTEEMEEVQTPVAANGTNPPPLPKRNTNRSSAIFTGSDDVAKEAGISKSEREEASSDSSPQIHPDASASLDAFVTPSETPAQGMSPILEQEAEHKEDTNKSQTFDEEAISTVVNESFSIGGSKEGNEVEAPTSTPNTYQFSKRDSSSRDSARPSHQRTSSAISTLSDTQGVVTPRPSTPKRSSVIGGSRSSIPSKLPTATSRPSTPNKGGSGSRPSTPNKTTPIGSGTTGSRPSTPNKGVAAPPPLPRRAAARNVVRRSVEVIPKKRVEVASEEKENEEMVPPTEEVKDAIVDGAKVVDEPLKSQDESAAEKIEEGSSEIQHGSSLLIYRRLYAHLISESVVARVEPSSESVQAPESVNSAVTEPQADKILVPDSAVDVSHSALPEKDIPTPKSIPTALPRAELPSPSTHPALSSAMETSDVVEGSRPRQPSVSASSVYSPSVYTTHSGIPGGQEENVEGRQIPGETVANKDTKGLRFYVGRGTWEERAWLELVRIRESMFWARLGGVRH